MQRTAIPIYTRTLPRPPRDPELNSCYEPSRKPSTISLLFAMRTPTGPLCTVTFLLKETRVSAQREEPQLQRQPRVRHASISMN